MTEKEYNGSGGGCALMNFPDSREWFVNWTMSRAKDRKRYVILADNRETFKRVFGKAHFHFHGSHYFHGWDIVFDGSPTGRKGVNAGRFLLLTAKDHGTCIEQVGRCRAETRVEFLEWLANKLEAR